MANRVLRICALAAAAAAVFMPAGTAAQNLGYEDADNAGEAVGMMRTRLWTSEAMLKQCTARAPDMADSMRASLEQWQQAEQLNLSKASYYWDSMAKKEPKMLAVEPMSYTAVETLFTNLAKVPDPTGVDYVRQYCLKHFRELAAGVWRARTPRVYQFLEAVELPPSR